MSSAFLLKISELVINRPLLILPEKMAILMEVLEGRIGIDSSGLIEAIPSETRIDADYINGLYTQVRAALGPGRPEPEAVVGDDRNGSEPTLYIRAGSKALIPVHGTLSNRHSLRNSLSGMTSYDQVRASLRQAMNDPRIESIVMDINSPGGQAVGAFELADEIRAARDVKPITSFVNGMAASAAYAIASATSKIVTTPSSLSGSIGVVMTHMDYSKALDKAGVKPTLIFAGDHKVDGNPYESLGKDVKDNLQAEVDQLYSMFVDKVALGRSMDPAEIRATKARTYIGTKAVELGLADAVGTLDEVLMESGPSRPRQKGASMSFTQEDLDKARKEGEAAALAAGQAAAAAATARIQSIMGLEEAKGREATANHLAFNTQMSVEDVKALLATMPASAAAPTVPTVGARNPENPLQLDTSKPGEDLNKDASSLWAKVVDRQNARLS